MANHMLSCLKTGLVTISRLCSAAVSGDGDCQKRQRRRMKRNIVDKETPINYLLALDPKCFWQKNQVWYFWNNNNNNIIIIDNNNNIFEWKLRPLYWSSPQSMFQCLPFLYPSASQVLEEQSVAKTIWSLISLNRQCSAIEPHLCFSAAPNQLWLCIINPMCSCWLLLWIEHSLVIFTTCSLHVFTRSSTWIPMS